MFRAVPTIRDKMETLKRVGLGYIKVGQQATTLSGGEAQRVKLSKELSRRATGRTLYILDEPTTGLHFEDVASYWKYCTNWSSTATRWWSSSTISMSSKPPTGSSTLDRGGDGGGEIVAVGSPEQVAASPDSFTGRYLAAILDRRRAPPAVPARRRVRVEA